MNAIVFILVKGKRSKVIPYSEAAQKTIDLYLDKGYKHTATIDSLKYISYLLQSDDVLNDIYELKINQNEKSI